MVKTQGTIDQLKNGFCLNVWCELHYFILKYKAIYDFDEEVLTEIKNQTDPGDMLLVFRDEMKAKQVSFYMIIDEYDNFANNVLIEHNEEMYRRIKHAGGFLRNFFTLIKGMTDNREIDSLFISGVSPLVMADVTSGFNIGENISLWPDFASMVGFNREELKELVDYYIPGQYETLFPYYQNGMIITVSMRN